MEKLFRLLRAKALNHTESILREALYVHRIILGGSEEGNFAAGQTLAGQKSSLGRATTSSRNPLLGILQEDFEEEIASMRPQDLL